MALGTLSIMYMVLIIIGVIIQFLLYTSKNERSNGIFIVNTLFALVLSYMAYTSQPTNFTSQRISAIVLAIIGLVGLVLKLKTVKNSLLSKLMISVAIIGSLVLLFI